jgi:MYXO-CTERM domain-containing protein
MVLLARLLVIWLVLWGGSAWAYVRSTSPKSGKAFSWLVSCLVVQPDGRGSQDLSIDQINETVVRATNNWSSRTDSCSNMRLTAIPADGPQEVAADGHPVVVFRDTVWARPGGIPHEPSAIGLTTVFHVSAPGQPGDATILDADIELNGVNYTFTTDPMNAVPRDGTSIADLENTLTHELGHVQGLAHTCWDHTTDTPPLDDKGVPIFDCNDPAMPPEVAMTTMFPYSFQPGETSKRMLSPDDQRGICEIFSNANPPAACFQKVTGGYPLGCAVSHGRPHEVMLPLLVVLAALWLRRREVA